MTKNGKYPNPQKKNLMMEWNEAELRQTNNLFFADDGKIHSNKAETVQEILDLAYGWGTEFGIKFYSSKCKQINFLVFNIRVSVLP